MMDAPTTRLQVILQLVEDGEDGPDTVTMEDGFEVEHPEPCAPTLELRGVIHAQLDAYLDALHRDMAQTNDAARRRIITPTNGIIRPGD